tara:strand:+ start:9309 stop:10487 length:1179 start_codon:yes stop_codon:yes gene_type:complete
LNKKLNVLVVGGGMYVVGYGSTNFGTIIPALLESRRSGLIDRIGIVTTNPKSANNAKVRTIKIAKKMGIPGDCEKFPKEKNNNEEFIVAAKQFKPDIVIIAVPDHLHSSISIKLINKGYHCLLVKPMAPTLNEAKLMTIAAKKAKVLAQVEFHKRLDESNLLLREAVQSKKLGDLLYAVIEYSQKKKIPRDFFNSWSTKTNIFQYLGIHYVDLLQYVTSFKPTKVSAWGQKGYLQSMGIDTWDSMQVIIEWNRNNKNKFISTHITNWIDPDKTSAMSDQRINLVGTKGRYQADQKNRGVQIVDDKDGVQDINPYFSTSWHDSSLSNIRFNGYGIRSIIQFISDVKKLNSNQVSLRYLNTNRPSFEFCQASSAVIEAVNSSINNNNKKIKVKI